MVWGSSELDTIIWDITTVDDNIVWGSDCDASAGGCDNVVWGSDASGNGVYGDVAADGTITEVPLANLTDGQLLKLMIKLALAPALPGGGL
jgi:hypothetical protein